MVFLCFAQFPSVITIVFTLYLLAIFFFLVKLGKLHDRKELWFPYLVCKKKNSSSRGAKLILGTLRSDNGDGDGNLRSLGRGSLCDVGVPVKLEITILKARTRTPWRGIWKTRLKDNSPRTISPRTY